MRDTAVKFFNVDQSLNAIGVRDLHLEGLRRQHNLSVLATQADGRTQKGVRPFSEA
jgi:hypothetical protein